MKSSNSCQVYYPNGSQKWVKSRRHPPKTDVQSLGSCNTLSAKITLNTHLASYPLGCLAYVLVHELCHLYHANHSANFWKSVENAMPDYKYWHDLLK